jgi:GGDEF domain-containing protein
MPFRGHSRGLALGAIAVSLVVTAELQFAVRDWSNLGLGYLYLLPVVIAGSWFGARAAAAVAVVATITVTVWYASVPNTPTVATEAVSLGIRGCAYLGVGVVVGLHSRTLRRLAYTDPLTGLPNRRAFFGRCEQAVAAGRHFGVLIADVDHLKQINDSLGHDAGDSAIREVVAALRAVLGPDAFVARVGGDEFIAVIPPGDVEAIQQGRQAILGASAGAAHYPRDGDTLDDVIAAADRRLYQQKRSGHSPSARSTYRTTSTAQVTSTSC